MPNYFAQLQNALADFPTAARIKRGIQQQELQNRLAQQQEQRLGRREARMAETQELQNRLAQQQEQRLGRREARMAETQELQNRLAQLRSQRQQKQFNQEQAMARLKVAGPMAQQILKSENPEQDYQAMREQYAQFFPEDAADMPETFTPEALQDTKRVTAMYQQIFSREPESYTLSPGERRFRGGEEIASVPAESEKSFDIGETREIKKGDRIITQEYTPEGWKQIADAPRSVAEPGGGITRKDLLSDVASINNKIASLQARQNIVSEAMQEEIDTAISGLNRAKNAYLQVLQGDATMEDFPSLLAGESPQRKEAEPEITQILKDENMPAGKKYKDEETGKIYYWDGTTATVVNE